MSPSETTDDATLARMAKGGSSAAFGGLVHRHHARVFAFLLALTRHRQDAEDLTQETFLRAWDKIHRFNPELQVLPWLFTIARRLSIAALRRSRPLPQDVDTATASEPENPAIRLWELAKSQLPPVAYEALWLHYHEEFPIQQVAAILGKREGAVKVILHRARKTLAASVHGGTPDDEPACLPEPQRSMP